MLRGILVAVVYYLMGISLAGLIYVNADNYYAHGPGFHHLIILLTIAVGFVWGIIALSRYFFNQRTDKLKGIILTHSSVIISFLIFMSVVIRTESTAPEQGEYKVSIAIIGDSTIVYDGDNLVYLKEGDSTYVDFIGVKNAIFDNKEAEIARLEQLMDSLHNKQ